jgi:hypothetical protein
MSELTGPKQGIATDHDVRGAEDAGKIRDLPPEAADDAKGEDGSVKGIPTDAEGVFADGEKGGLPVFDVSQQDFYNNMKQDRRRLRFGKDTNASKYMRTTRYRRPFYVRNKDDGYMFKVK